jgi:hypothetical protein
LKVEVTVVMGAHSHPTGVGDARAREPGAARPR